MQTFPVTMKSIRKIRAAQEEIFPSCMFFYVLEGEVLFTFGPEPVRHLRTDLLFLPPRRQLRMSSAEGCRILMIGISEDFFDDHLEIRPLTVLSTATESEGDYLPLKRTILKIAEYDIPDLAFSDTDALNLMSQLYRLLACVSELMPARTGQTVPDRHAHRVQEIADYIDRHYAESLSLPELASAFYLTPQYLSGFFREHFGTNFKSFLTEKRLRRTLRDLRNEPLTISEIALKNGFASVSAFQKNFRKMYGLSPSEYRAGLKKEEAVHAAVIEPERMEEGDSPAGVTVTLRTNAEARVYPHVNRMINTGPARNLLSDRFRLHLRSFCQETRIRYIRIEEMLSNSFMPMILPHYEYYFQNADIVLNFLYENNLVPMIELTRAGTEIEEVGSARREHFFIPRNERFFRLLESFLKHVSRRWPVSWLKEWLFEMWMLPRDTTETYTNDLMRVEDLLSSLIPGAKIGGPGYDPFVHTVPPEDLLETFRTKGFRPGFFSAVLHYHSRPKDRIPLISRDPDLLFKECLRYRTLLREDGQNIPLYITAWSSANPPAAPTTASLYQAAFVARTWAGLDAYCDLASYWLYNDADQKDINSVPSLSRFGRGLLGDNFVPYAAFFAYTLSASLGCEVLSEGSCYRFVRSEKHHYQLLAFHYVHFRGDTDPLIMDAADFDLVYNLFEDTGAFPFAAELTGLSPGLYHITKTLIDSGHGSILDIIISEFTNSNIDRFEFLKHAQTAAVSHSYRAESCVPVTRSAYIETEASLSLSTVLPPHAVCLWDIRRQL